MDPLSVTLAVVSFATVVKDLVKLGQKVHESFAKVSKSLHSAQRIADNIKEMVDEIKTFCEDHKDVLANMKDFCGALQGLLAWVKNLCLQRWGSSDWGSEFRSFEASIIPLLHKMSRRKSASFISGWWNNNKIQESILDLESNIVKLMRGFMMKNAMRAEVKLEAIHQDTNKGLVDVRNDITAGFDVIRSDISALHITTAANAVAQRSYESSLGTTSDEFNNNVIMFAQSTLSTSAPMLRTPNVITEELMTAAYIKLQIKSIAIIVERMLMLPTSATNTTSYGVEGFRISTILDDASMSITHLRHHVVRRVTSIRDLLDTLSIHIISIQDGARALNELSHALGTLGMNHGSVLLGNWAIALMRMLVANSGGGHPERRVHLALYLYNQSIRYNGSGDKIRSLQTIEEAYTITQDLRNQYKGETHFQMLYSSILFRYARFGDNQWPIQMSVNAIQVLEDILKVQAFTMANGEIQSVIQPASSFFDRLFSLAPPITALLDYASCLQKLGTLIYRNGPGWHDSALALARLAIALHQNIVSIHGHVYKSGLALALLALIRGRTAGHIPRGELVDMADECIQLLRELTENNPLYYARSLVNALWVKATTLENLSRDTEAIATWEEATSIARQIVQDSPLCARALGHLSNQFRRLKRHDDAVRTGTLAITTYHDKHETRAKRYFFLSRDLLQLQRYKEAAEAARTSVALYRHLTMRDPRKWMSNLTESLSDLAHCLAALGNYAEVSITWTESVGMLNNFLNTNTSASSGIINRYCAALAIHREISLILRDEEECFKICSTAIQYLRRLLEAYPHNEDLVTWHLFWTQFFYAHNMIRAGRLQEAQCYIDCWLDVWNSKPKAVSESNIVSWHAAMLTLKADALDAQGHTEQALLATQKVPNIVGLSINTCGSSFAEMIESVVQKSRLQVNLGNTREALQVAEEALSLSRGNKLEPIVNSLMWSLYGVVFAASSCREYKRAMEVAREACDILATPENLNLWQKGGYFSLIRPRLFSLVSSAEGNLGEYNTALEYAHCAVDASLETMVMKAEISATYTERSYMETRGNLAEILLVTGDLAQARQICEERSTYFSKRVETRMGEYRDLAPILRMLGILCCNEGLHKEGEAAARELSRIMKTLGTAFPSLQEQVKIRLRNQAHVPILNVLDDMSQKLGCGHQTEVKSLFAI